MHQASKPRAANQSMTEESGRPGTVRSKVGWEAIDEPCTKSTVPLGVVPAGGGFCHRNSLTSPLRIQCSSPTILAEAECCMQFSDFETYFRMGTIGYFGGSGVAESINISGP